MEGSCGLCETYQDAEAQFSDVCNKCPFPGGGTHRCMKAKFNDIHAYGFKGGHIDNEDYCNSVVAFYRKWLETGEAPPLPFYTDDYKKDDGICPHCEGGML